MKQRVSPTSAIVVALVVVVLAVALWQLTYGIRPFAQGETASADIAPAAALPQPLPTDPTAATPTPSDGTETD